MTAVRTCPICGYTGKYGSEAIATVRHPRHSCAKHRRKDETARARAARIAARPIRDCLHTTVHHEHGTRNTYLEDRCRCAPCTAANAAAGHTHGDPRGPLVDAAPIRAHLQALRANGISHQQIAGLIRVPLKTLDAIAYGRNGVAVHRVRARPARRILTIPNRPEYRADRTRIDATGTRRRLQALTAIGWPLPLLAAELCRTETSVLRTMGRRNVTQRTARNVRNLYDRRWDTRPPEPTTEQRAAAEQARSHARRHGWPVPLDWDDIDNDPDNAAYPEPGADPDSDLRTADADLDEFAVEIAVDGGVRLSHLTRAEQEEVVRRLTQRGKSLREIAEQLHTTPRTISRRRGSIIAA